MILNKIQYKLKIITRNFSNIFRGRAFSWGYLSFLLISFASIVILGFNIYKVVKLGYKRYQFINKEQQILEELREENESLKEIVKFYSSPEYIEYKSREELNLTFPGYKIVYVESAEDNDFFYDEVVDSEELEVSPSWRLWWNLLFG